MSKINYQKILDKLIDEHPHEIATIKKVIEDSREKNQKAHIELKKIIENRNWNAEEKYQLLSLIEANVFADVPKYNYIYRREEKVSLFSYLMDHDLEDSFVACVRRMMDLESFYIGHTIGLEEAFRNLIYRINNSEVSFDKKVKYLSLALENTKEDILKKTIQTSFKGRSIEWISNTSIFLDIIKTKDLNLIKKYSKYLDDPLGLNLYLVPAIKTGDIEIVKYFLDNGADPNFLYSERLLGYITPIKMAIRCNNVAIYNLLKSRGAKTNERIDDPDFKENVKKWNINIIGLTRNAIDIFDERPEIVNKLEFQRCSSPFEYATTLDPEKPFQDRDNYVWYTIKFYDSSIEIPNQKLSESSKNRAIIIDDLYESIEDKSTIDYDKLLISTLAIRAFDLFKKYAQYTLDNHIELSIKDIIDAYFTYHIAKSKDGEDIADYFLDLVEKVSKEKNMLYFLQKYYKESTKWLFDSRITMTDLLKKILDRLSIQERLTVPLMTRAKNLETVLELEKYGYDVNQTDKDGHNILYYLLYARYSNKELTQEELKLFDYLIDKIDLSKKDNEGKNILYYAMKIFPTKDDIHHTTPEHFGPRSNLELATCKLIDKMNKKDVCDEQNKDLLENRIERYDERNYGDHINIELIYQRHKDLFDALIKKGFKFSDNFYSNLFSNVFTEEDMHKKILEESIDFNETVKYIFEKLDRDTKVQKLAIQPLYEEIIKYLNEKDVKFEDFVKKFIDFNNKIVDLSTFYNNHIQKRYNPKRYLEYAKEKYQTTYDGLDDMLLTILTKIILKFPSEDIDTILSLVPNYDINHKIENFETDYSYWTYYSELYPMKYNEETEENEQIEAEGRFEAECYDTSYDDKMLLNGGLVQFAILINNLDLLKKLVAAGANIRHIIDDEDHSFDYVSSTAILEYLESILGNHKLSDFGDEERKYYLALLGEKK